SATCHAPSTLRSSPGVPLLWPVFLRCHCAGASGSGPVTGSAGVVAKYALLPLASFRRLESPSSRSPPLPPQAARKSETQAIATAGRPCVIWRIDSRLAGPDDEVYGVRRPG